MQRWSGEAEQEESSAAAAAAAAAFGGESTRRWEELQTNRAVWRPVATRIPIKAFVLLAYLRKVHNPSLQHVIWFAENHTSNKSYPNLEVTKDARSH